MAFVSSCFGVPKIQELASGSKGSGALFFQGAPFLDMFEGDDRLDDWHDPSFLYMNVPLNPSIDWIELR